jgi:hypothetical protein
MIAREGLLTVKSNPRRSEHMQKAKTKPFMCRLPVETYQAIHDLAGGPKSIGSFVNQLFQDYLQRDKQLVRTVLAVLEERAGTK